MDNTVEVQELGKVMITPKGEYSSSKSYEILDAVSYNGSSYVSKINDNTSVPTSNDWQLLAQKGDVYDVAEEDLQAIAKQIIDNANSAFNQNVKTKTKEFNTNATNKLNDYDINSKSTTETFDANAKKKLDEYNANDTKKLKAYNDNANNKLSAYNTNDTNKLKAYNTNADSKIEEYNTNANSKIAEYDKHSEELRNMAISTDNELERVKNEILDTGSASDSFIHVEDSFMAKIKELEIDGVINQKTTTGKNKLNLEFSNELSTLAGMTFSHTKSEFTLNGTATSTWQSMALKNNLPIDAGKTYSLSANIEGTNPKMQITLRAFNDSNPLFSIPILKSNNYKNTVTASFTDEITKCDFVVEGLTVGEVYNLTAEVQFEENSTPTDYEPYTGGQPSPSPDYPQKIKTITDGLNITSCNKNIFNFNETKNLKKYNCDYKYENDILELTQTSQWTYVSCDIKVKPNTTYVYSFEMDFEGINRPSNWWLSLNDTKGTTYNKNLVSFINDKIYKIFNTTNSNTLQILFTGSTTTIPTKTIFKNIQLEENPSLTDFEQNLLSKIEAKLPENEFIGKFDGTYKDIVRTEYFPEEGQYHLMLDKMMGKYTFTGNENWSTYTQSNGIPIFRCTLPASGYVVKSNYFVSQTTWPTLLEENRIFNHVGNYQNIEIACSKFDTLTNFKNFLTTNVVQMYYGLKTPYTLDLGPIDMPLSYKRITNIFTDSDLLPKITAKYYRTFEKTIQNMQINEKSLKQEINDLNNNISDITKRLEALESANASIVEESEASNDLQN
jgi:hypothetical protein